MAEDTPQTGQPGETGETGERGKADAPRKRQTRRNSATGAAAEIAAEIARAEGLADFRARAAADPIGGLDGILAPDGDADGADPEIVARCAALDQSDTSNGQRLIAHFGGEVVVMAQEGAPHPVFGGWSGRHWDFPNGRHRAFATAQRLGDRIALEALHVAPTPKEDLALAAGKALKGRPEDELTPEDRAAKGRALAARKAIQARRGKRIAFAIGSKNKGRLEAMLACAAPHLLAEPDAFNHDDLAFACAGHTIRFRRERQRVPNPEFSDPEISSDSVPEFIEGRARVTIAVTPGHDRSDRITQLVGAAYDPGAECPRWLAFLDDLMPDAGVRHLLQTACGLGLLGITTQHLFFHYGKGANGKSIFLEALARLFDGHAVTLPAESITGSSARSGSGPSPDLARLYGKRFLRVAELPQGEPLRIELIKKLTGGEAFPVRSLFQGFFDFRPQFVAHMSGNGYPKTDESDHGTWRRMVVIRWPVTIAPGRQRPFEEMLAEFVPEWPGILNWLIAGAIRFLEEGLVIPDSVHEEVRKYRDEVDPLAGFIAACCRTVPGASVTAREAYTAYKDWAEANGVNPIFETSFGKKFKNHFERRDGRVRTYQDLAIDPVGASGGPVAPPPGEEIFP